MSERITQENVEKVMTDTSVADMQAEIVPVKKTKSEIAKEREAKKRLEAKNNAVEVTTPEPEEVPATMEVEVEVEDKKLEFTDKKVREMVKGAENHMIEVLQAQMDRGEVVEMLVPEELVGKSIEIQINGLCLSYPTEEYVKMPVSVANLVKTYLNTVKNSGRKGFVGMDGNPKSMRIEDRVK